MEYPREVDGRHVGTVERLHAPGARTEKGYPTDCLWAARDTGLTGWHGRFQSLTSAIDALLKKGGQA